MPAVTITDLNNAKTDVDKISEFMESASASMTTRAGSTVQTRSGLIAELNADAAVTATWLNRTAAETAETNAESAQAAAEAARDAANTAGKVFADTTAGLAGTVSGESFSVFDGNHIIQYRNDTGVATEVGRFYVKAYFDAFVETLFSHTDYLWGVTDIAGRKLLALALDGGLDIGGSQVQGSYDHTDYLWAVVDANDRVLLAVGKDGSITGNIELSETIAARGSRDTLAERISAGLTPYGDPIGPYAHTWALRETRMRLRKLALGESVQLVIAIIGDSYTQAPTRYTGALAKTLQDEYGLAGVGWIGFGWAGGGGAGPWSSGTQPTLKDGSVRTDLVTTMEIIGAWTCSYNTGANNTPSLSKITSSTVDDYVRFTVPAGHDTARLFYAGDGTGVIAVSWNDGGSYGANISLSTVGAGSVDLGAVTAGTCRIKVVSGNVALSGVNLTHSTAAGVIVHKLGGSGSHTGQWVTVTAATWAAQLQQLGSHVHVIMHGTNDQGQSTTPAAFAANLETMFTSIDMVLPYSDKLVAMPAENQRTTNTYAMTAYATAAREYAAADGIPYCDLQYFFGSPDSFAFEYSAANTARPWYSTDLVHPDPTTGGRVMADALVRLFTTL